MSAAEGARYRVAGFWRRLSAGAVDALVLAPLVLLLAGITASVGGESLPRFSELGLAYAVNLALSGGAAGVAALGMAALTCALYFFIFHAARGQTPGKRLLGLKVIDVYGVRPSVLRAAARTLGYLPSLLFFSLGFLWIGFDREKRGLHDWIAGTYVVIAQKGVPAVAAEAR
jgi:uncharacterized RDD family membrane protein YckC